MSEAGKLRNERSTAGQEGVRRGLAPGVAAGTSLHLFLIRHGETGWALTGQHTGRTDIALTARGEAQARELGRVLQGVAFSRVLTSPLERARQTCERVAPDRAFVLEPDLAECDYGDYEGKTSADILRQRPGWDLFRDGCPHGEAPTQICARADRLVARLRRESGNVALFSHGHFGAALAARWIGLAVAEARHFPLGTASLSVLAFDPHHPQVPTIALWNSDCKHGFEPSFATSMAPRAGP